ncbi:hypothetical protein [Paucibacter sp. DJ2R-2]|uniref:hypothetical protein n=1 Tax=Paucibacter sp. DJ2R-2 TaxID=2893558 RepID=UPI0021E4D45A|nr:hypothetical protein [Paucibacter sp. DJ2R-2]MCV2438624.1 hypothetical protein [Paucibacter sp. DJ2R-2]
MRKASKVMLYGLCAALAAIAGCGGGSGEGLDANGRPIGEGDDPAGPMTAKFSSIQSHVFTPACTACHSGAAAPRGLRLDASNSFVMLVGVSSGGVPALKRVAPGDADNSYLIHKLEGHQAVGARMPLGGPYLDAQTIGLIRQWINNGAQK